MRQTEIDYWNGQFGKDVVHENVHKRQAIVERLLRLKLIGKNICEIGAGSGVTANAVMAAVCGQMGYFGTELSKISADRIRELFGLDVVNADILSIPALDAIFDMVWAFDVLEHVRPEDREAGYREIGRILKPGGLIVLNQPTMETNHNLEFDHGFDITDLVSLMQQTNSDLVLYQKYSVSLPVHGEIRYIWIMLEKR